MEDGAFWKLPNDIFGTFSAKRKENDTAMFIITSPVDDPKWRLS